MTSKGNTDVNVNVKVNIFNKKIKCETIIPAIIMLRAANFE